MTKQATQDTGSRLALIRARLLWFSFAWILTFVLLTLGGAYGLGGTHVIVATRSFTVLLRWLPLGVRGHGIIMAVLGVALLLELTAPTYGHVLPWRWLRATLLLCGAYLMWTVYAFATAPLAGGGRFSVTGVITWLGFMIMPFVLVRLPPPEYVDRR